MTYISEIRRFLETCGPFRIYEQQPALPNGNKPHRLTKADRRKVEQRSTERGYRRFCAERVTRI